YSALRRDLDIRRFQIAMDDVFFMCSLESLSDLPRVVQNLWNGQRAAQCFAFYQFQHQESRALGFLQSVNCGDIGMIERRQSARFLSYRSQSLRVVCKLAGQSLDRNIAPEFAVMRAIDLAHAASAYWR